MTHLIYAQFLALILTGYLAGAGPGESLKKRVPEDLGSNEIDVSHYPPQYQKTYREIFVPVFSALGGTARAVNSPVIELDPRMEAAERRANPQLFSDPALAEISGDGWKKRVQEIHRRPPCCGACPVLSMQDAKALWHFLVYDSIMRKTGPNAGSWIHQRKDMLIRFEKEIQKESPLKKS